MLAFARLSIYSTEVLQVCLPAISLGYIACDEQSNELHGSGATTLTSIMLCADNMITGPMQLKHNILIVHPFACSSRAVQEHLLHMRCSW